MRIGVRLAIAPRLNHLVIFLAVSPCRGSQEGSVPRGRCACERNDLLRLAPNTVSPLLVPAEHGPECQPTATLRVRLRTDENRGGRFDRLAGGDGPASVEAHLPRWGRLLRFLPLM